jgi:hypothetical protein
MRSDKSFFSLHIDKHSLRFSSGISASNSTIARIVPPGSYRSLTPSETQSPFRLTNISPSPVSSHLKFMKKIFSICCAICGETINFPFSKSLTLLHLNPNFSPKSDWVKFSSFLISLILSPACMFTEKMSKIYYILLDNEANLLYYEQVFTIGGYSR